MASFQVPLSGPDTETFLTSEPQTYGTVDQAGVPSLLYGGNVSSVTDQAVGQTNVSFTNSYDAIDWGHAGMADFSGANQSTCFIFNKATSSVRLYVFAGTAGGGYGDTSNFGFSFSGDLA